jgi:predicted nuclease of predicted toxin-antitoxin system
MKFVADEGVDASLVRLLREAGHDVYYFAETHQSTDDSIILEIANRERRILLTRDKDFGELV